ncbi:hypothetical protein WME99_18845 [Sorangium sp. So ce136]
MAERDDRRLVFVKKWRHDANLTIAVNVETPLHLDDEGRRTIGVRRTCVEPYRDMSGIKRSSRQGDLEEQSVSCSNVAGPNPPQAVASDGDKRNLVVQCHPISSGVLLSGRGLPIVYEQSGDGC